MLNAPAIAWSYGLACLLYTIASVAGVMAALTARPHRLSRCLKGFVVGGWLAHTVSLILLGIIEGHHPASTPQEVLSFLVWAAVIVYVVVDAFHGVRAFGAFFVPTITALCIGAALLDGGESTPSAGGVWLRIHGTAALLGSAAFILGACAALMYLLLERQLRRVNSGRLFAILPPLNVLDRINWLAVTIGFVLFSVALLSGAALARAKAAEEIRGALPMLGFSFLAWALFGIVLYCRLSGRVRGRRIAYLTLLGLIVLVAVLVMLFMATDTLHAWNRMSPAAWWPPCPGGATCSSS